MSNIALSYLVLLVHYHSTFGISFRCTFSVETWSHIGKVYVCSPNIVDSDNQSHLNEVKGDHLKGLSNPDVQLLNVQDQMMSHIARGIEKFFPNLEGIRWFRSNLVAITSSDLQPFPKLRFFRAHSNKLFSLDDDVFKYTPKIEYIDFRDNQLQAIGSKLLSNLSELQEVDFRNNRCINDMAESPDEIPGLIKKLIAFCENKSSEPSTTTGNAPVSAPENSIISTKVIHKIMDHLQMVEERIKKLEQQKSENLTTTTGDKIHKITDQLMVIAERIEKIEQQNSENLTTAEDKIHEISDHQKVIEERIENIEQQKSEFDISIASLLSEVQDLKGDIKGQGEGIVKNFKSIEDLNALLKDKIKKLIQLIKLI